ncbi:MAG TPA: PIN domain-containing protein [Acidimicrobiia bacterium]|nr:PIN domain-containing protein [Acidimicrobiia bacterium]HKN89656.1 PIN domain-containing protein [Acidimicrobiia bacterium]
MPTTPSIARGMVEIDRQTLPDPADRTIAATAVAMGLPAVSSDDRLRKAGDRGVLQVVR